MIREHEAMDDTAEFGARLNTSEGGYRIDTHRVMSCTGPCDQGRKDCPCPQQCEQPEDDNTDVSGALAWPVYCLVAVLAVLACWHLAGRLVA